MQTSGGRCVVGACRVSLLPRLSLAAAIGFIGRGPWSWVIMMSGWRSCLLSQRVPQIGVCVEKGAMGSTKTLTAG